MGRTKDLSKRSIQRSFVETSKKTDAKTENDDKPWDLTHLSTALESAEKDDPSKTLELELAKEKRKLRSLRKQYKEAHSKLRGFKKFKYCYFCGRPKRNPSVLTIRSYNSEPVMMPRCDSRQPKVA